MFMDPIADLICKIKNAINVKLPTIKIQTSKLTTNILKVMLDEGYINQYKIIEINAKKKGKKKQITIVELKYKNRISVINGIKQISKPGLRNYAQANKIPNVLNGLGIAIVSTNQGIVTGKFAKKNNLGGEVIACVW